MTCEWVRMPDGMLVHVKHSHKRRIACSRCRQLATRACDWKVGLGRTCDRSLCDTCTHEPAPGKDLCPEHAAAWAERQKAPTG